ncbi:MAG: glycosyltransferase [Rhodospirillaceae bacterium]|jgi:dolichol-phosphate mannosyltransferase|nr:glycosyltransferase [Rhodospirillaceae bacterium]|tara:strand:- start:381 stop:1358 length:978 start_codon:yes stop_codon:yes gene_type:complete
MSSRVDTDITAKLDGNSDPELSIVVPVLNEQENIRELFDQILKVVENNLKVSFELLFVDDGSRDRSWEIICALHDDDARVRAIRFSRNFGHQTALKAGIDSANGAAVITMDADLQHPPAMIETLYAKWKEGFEVVNTAKQDTKGLGFIKKTFTKMGYFIINLLAEVRIEPGAADFRLMDRRVVDYIRGLGEVQLLLRGIVNWLGFSSTTLEYVAEARFAGKSKYTLRQLTSLVLWGVMSFSGAPLRLSVYVGFTAASLGFGYGLFLTIRWFLVGVDIPGWTTTSALILFFSGTILLVLGIIGEYIAKIYDEIKGRPPYVIAEKTK